MALGRRRALDSPAEPSSRSERPTPAPRPAARRRSRDARDQDTARALLTIADEAGARVAFVGDRHQFPAVGRGGALDHAAEWALPTAVVTLEKVRRFVDSEYAALSLRMRTGDDAGRVFDALHRSGHIAIHASDVERTAALADAGASGDLVIADTREQVADLNAAIRHQRHLENTRGEITTAGGDRIRIGNRVATRRNDPDLQVANRQTWTVARVGRDDSLLLHGRGRNREVPPLRGQTTPISAAIRALYPAGSSGGSSREAPPLASSVNGCHAARTESGRRMFGQSSPNRAPSTVSTSTSSGPWHSASS